MKKLIAVIIIAAVIGSFASIAYAASSEPSASPSVTKMTTAAASRQNEVLSVPSGNVVTQPLGQPAGTVDGTMVQYIIIGIAAAVVVILLVVFRRKYKDKNNDDL